MTKKTIGYIELEWTCKRCGTKNPGTSKTCSNCGAPMPEGEQFELPAEQKLISDQEKIAQAGHGPDVACSYCGTRNPAGTPVCAQCGGDLKGAKAREKGQVLGAFQAGPAAEIPCPACSTPNQAGAPRCKNCGAALAGTPAALRPAAPPSKTGTGGRTGLIIGIAVLVFVLCAGAAALFALSARTTDTTAVVQSVEWERSIQILEQRPVQHEDWQDSIPASAPVGGCTERVRSVQSEPVSGAEEVCGTPYTEDEGSGLGRVVQDCEYHVYDNWCSFTVEEWQVIDSTALQGSDLSPAWPELALQADQRQGDRAESYLVTFRSESGDKTYTYQVNEPARFASFAPGTRWSLAINGLGAVVDVQEK
jgi:hypothetical protein